MRPVSVRDDRVRRHADLERRTYSFSAVSVQGRARTCADRLLVTQAGLFVLGDAYQVVLEAPELFRQVANCE